MTVGSPVAIQGRSVTVRNDEGWAMTPPGSACTFEVRVLPHSPITYSIALNKVQDFALHGTAKGPQDIFRKKRVKELLGLG